MPQESLDVMAREVVRLGDAEMEQLGMAPRGGQRWILIEGVGDVIQNYYLPALQKIFARIPTQDRPRITFADESKYWRDSSEKISKMEQTITDIQNSLGGEYLDKSKPAELTKYLDNQETQPTDVVIATPDFTHVGLAEHWLGRGSSALQGVYIEKPLDSSIEAARRLRETVESSGNPFSDQLVYAFDHYRGKLYPDDGVSSRQLLAQVLGHLDVGADRPGRLAQFAFYFLENHSGDDAEFAAERLHPKNLSQKNGPLENENRLPSVQDGLILDMMPHILAVLEYFVSVSSMRIRNVKAGQYYFGPSDTRECRAGIQGETFAEILVQCNTYISKAKVEGRAYIGKGIKGVHALGQEFDHNSKALDLWNQSRAQVRFDLRRGRVILFGGEPDGTNRVITLRRNAYEVFIEKIIDGTCIKDELVFPVAAAVEMLEKIELMRSAIPTGDRLPGYPCGIADPYRESMYLEDLQMHLPVLFSDESA